MEIRVILNGELKTCCSAYPTDQVQSILNGWFAGSDKVKAIVVDIKKEKWEADDRFVMAYKYFGNNVFPLVFVGNKLVAIGNLPSRDQLWMLATTENEDEITLKDIEEAAQKQGLVETQNN